MATKFLLDGDVLKPAVSSQDTWTMCRTTDGKDAEAPIMFDVNSKGRFVPREVGGIREYLDGSGDLRVDAKDRDCNNVELRKRYAIRVVQIII